MRLVEGKIAEAKALMKKSVGCAIDDMDTLDEHLEQQEREAKIKQLVRQEIEEEDEDEVVSNRAKPPRY